MTLPLIIIGAGGFGRESLDVVLAQNAAAERPIFEVIGIVDSNPSPENLKRLVALDIEYLGDEIKWIRQRRNAEYLVGVGDPRARKDISQRFESAGYRPATAIHPSAVIGSKSSIAPGTVVCSGAQISTNVRLGRHVHVNPNATIGHDSDIGDFVSLNPGSIISGNVQCGSGALIGAGAVVLQGLSVGPHSIVGAAACVTRNVKANDLVKGVPAN
jgi:sugar O-acyltransferase (sialic acid O-acetyltransferase NeuD family)